MKFYDAIIYHKRINKEHSFKFKGFYCTTDDLNNPEGIFVTYDPKDYLLGNDDLKSDVINIIKSETNLDVSKDKIEIQFFPKIFGFNFNPLVIYRVYDNNSNIKCALLEVSNTWGGKHFYVVTSLDSYVKKQFHVSPFNQIEGDYHVVISDKKCQVNINVDGSEIFTSSIEGFENSFLKIFAWLKYPVYGYRIMFEIHKHAFLLFLKKNKFYGTLNKKEGNIC